MKNWFILFVFFFIMGCDDNAINPKYNEIKIEKYYPYLLEKSTLDNIEDNKTELFDHKIQLINSLNQLNENPLFDYCSASFKENLIESDFNRYTLIITTTMTFQNVIGVEYDFRYYPSLLQFKCSQILYTENTTTTSFEMISFVANAFLVKKISDDSNLFFTIGSRPKNK